MSQASTPQTPTPPDAPGEAHRAQRTPPPMTDAVVRSFRHCHRVTRQRARNFYHGLKLTPEPKRSAVYAIYAFMRACDDLVDEAPDQSPADGRDPHTATTGAIARLEQFRATMQQVLNTPPDANAPLPPGEIWPAFHYVVHAYPVQPAHLHAMLDGQRLDLTQRRYPSFEALYDYCFKVASTVGLVCVAIWGHDDHPEVHQYAEYRGIAFQLTNILRDLVEDIDRDRIYLPQEELDRFGYRERDLKRRIANEHFDRLMLYQIERARSYYQMSAPLENHLDRSCRATSRVMTQIYRRLLERIAEDPRRVLRQRVRLGGMEKIRLAFAAAWRRALPWV